MLKITLTALTALTLALSACTVPSANHNPGPTPADKVQANRIVDTGQACGGMVGRVCRQAQDFCYMAAAQQCGAADQTGICTPKPEMCTMDYRPVCGCDGKTYGNECAANSAGVSAAYAGECRT